MLFFPFAVQPPAASCYSPPPCFSQSLAQMVFCSCSCRQRSGKPPTNPPAGDPWPASGSHDRWWPSRDYYRGSSRGTAGGPPSSRNPSCSARCPIDGTGRPHKPPARSERSTPIQTPTNPICGKKPARACQEIQRSDQLGPAHFRFSGHAPPPWERPNPLILLPHRSRVERTRTIPASSSTERKD